MFKLAIAGLGWWGKVIINRLSDSKNIKIVFLIDPKPDTEALKLAANKKIPIFSNFEETLLNNKVDGIVLCTPNTLHMKQTIFCAKIGIHVYCEKPLSLLPGEVKKMICRSCKKSLLPGRTSRIRVTSKVIFRTCLRCGRVNREILGTDGDC